MIDRLVIDVPQFYPEGVARADDGTFYVSSFTTGAIVRVAAGERIAVPFLPAGTLAGGGVGLRLRGGTLWACGADITGAVPSAVYRIDVEGGAVARSFALPGGGFCNDLDLGPDGSLYVTDSFGGRILRLAPGAEDLQTWAADPSWVPGTTFPLSLNGIAVRDGAAVYAGRSDNGDLIRVDIARDGSAGARAVVYSGGPSAGIDGLRWTRDGRLLAVTGRSALSVLVEAGRDTWAATQLAAPLDEPATFALDPAGDAWVTEARFSLLYDGDDATHALPPFHVVRVEVAK